LSDKKILGSAKKEILDEILEFIENLNFKNFEILQDDIDSPEFIYLAIKAGKQAFYHINYARGLAKINIKVPNYTKIQRSNFFNF